MRWEMTVSGPRLDWKAERERIDLAAVATNLLGPAPGRRGERGRRLWWSCPFHEDRNPSFAVDPRKRWWKCYGCGVSGDAATLVMRLEGLSFPEAIERLTGGPPSRRRSPAKAAVRPVARPTYERPPEQPSGMPEADALALVDDAAARLWSPEGTEAMRYVTGPRCLSTETIRAARLGWTPRADGVAWKPPGWLIPWFDGSRLALVKVRVSDAWRKAYRAGSPPGSNPRSTWKPFATPPGWSATPAPRRSSPGAR
jgi:hypothetical protein